MNSKRKNNRSIRITVCQSPFFYTEIYDLGTMTVYHALLSHGFFVNYVNLSRILFNRLTKADQLTFKEFLVTSFFNSSALQNKIAEIFNGYADILVDNIVRQDTPPAIVCMSYDIKNINFICSISEKIKKYHPDTTIIIGRIHEPSEANFIFSHAPVDYVYPLRDLSDFLHFVSKFPSPRYPSTILSRSKGWISKQHPRYSPTNITAPILPMPEKYQYGNIYLGEGCPNRCRFCNEYALQRTIRLRDIGNIIDELKLRIREGTLNFYFNTLAINSSQDYLTALCKNIARHFREDISIFAQGFFSSHLDRHIIKLMRRAFVKKISWGLETGSSRLLMKMNKFSDMEIIENILKTSHEAGIINSLFLITGFPGEEDEDVERTIRFLQNNKTYIHSVDCLQPCHISAKSPLSKNRDLIITNSFDWRTKDGSNTPQVRLKRYLRIAKNLYRLKIPFLESTHKHFGQLHFIAHYENLYHILPSSQRRKN